MRQKFWACPHDGTFDGDSAFYPPGNAILYKEGMTLDDIKKAYARDLARRDEYLSAEEAEEMASEIKGAWIITGQIKRVVSGIVTSQGNDGACYAMNHARKMAIHEGATKTIGKKPKETW